MKCEDDASKPCFLLATVHISMQEYTCLQLQDIVFSVFMYQNWTSLGLYMQIVPYLFRGLSDCGLINPPFSLFFSGESGDVLVM